MLSTKATELWKSGARLAATLVAYSDSHRRQDLADTRLFIAQMRSLLSEVEEELDKRDPQKVQSDPWLWAVLASSGESK